MFVIRSIKKLNNINVVRNISTVTNTFSSSDVATLPASMLQNKKKKKFHNKKLIMENNLNLINNQMALMSPQEIIEWSCKRNSVLLSTFGSQAIILIDMAIKINKDIPIIMIDTGFLFNETYQYVETLKKNLNLNLTILTPNMTSQRMISTYGELWRNDDKSSHILYGKITKKDPLKNYIDQYKPPIILSGLRRTQTKHRAELPYINFEKEGYYKVLPILDMDDKSVENYINENNLLRHPLTEKGYLSIGDWHSSRPIKDNEENIRATRFGGRFEECGLHVNDDAEVDAMINKKIHNEFSKARIQLTKDKSLSILSCHDKNQKDQIITHLVKKQMINGDMCKKCNQVADKLKKDGLEDKIHGVSIARENEMNSDGNILSKYFNQNKAPFFIVKENELDTDWKVIYSYNEWKNMMKQNLKKKNLGT